jgi:mediator of RNA polymerase II transcription subunit 5
LLEPFLLPSLLIALQWLSSHLWQTTTETKISLCLLQSLIKPPSSTEAREIHQTILSITAEPLQLQLRVIGAEDAQKQLATTIADTLTPYVPLKRNTGWMAEVLQSSAASRGLLASSRQSFRQLLNWSTSLDVNTSPPKFTSKIFSAAVHLHGTSKVLLVFLEELKALLGTNQFDAGIDMVSSIICAPLPGTHTPMHCLSLRDGLKTLHADLGKLLKKGDTASAEALVRLHRRVEAFSAVVPQQDIAMDPTTSMGPDLADMDLQNINLDATAGNAEIDVGALGVQPTTEDIDQILEGATSLENFGDSTMGSGVDDVFGLDGGDMLNFDDMDLEGMF